MVVLPLLLLLLSLAGLMDVGWCHGQIDVSGDDRTFYVVSIALGVCDPGVNTLSVLYQQWWWWLVGWNGESRYSRIY